MIYRYLIGIALVLTATPVFNKAQDEEPSKIPGPLVTMDEGSFADTLMVLLQSLYYNDNVFVLDTQSSTVTVLGVNLIVQYEGILTLEQATVKKSSVSTDGKIIDLTMDVPTLVVNKTYTIRSAQDPDYVSKGTVSLTVDDLQVMITMSSSQIPYFVSSVLRLNDGTLVTDIQGEGIPLADEIQDNLQELVKTQFHSVDVSGFFSDVHDKLTDIFQKNELILCLSCEYTYCKCYE